MSESGFPGFWDFQDSHPHPEHPLILIILILTIPASKDLASSCQVANHIAIQRSYSDSAIAPGRVKNRTASDSTGRAIIAIMPAV